MKKFRFLFVILLSLFVVQVDAVRKDASVSRDLNVYSCTEFQEKSVNIVGDTYFGRCLEAQCNGSKWNLKYYSNASVTCKNGNLNPYTKITKDGCENYRRNRCDGSVIKYCTTITYYDCDRTTNGSKFTTTTKTTKPTSRPTTGTTKPTTNTTVPVKDNNTYLSSIELSSGSINFNKNVKEYSITVNNDIVNINVVALPEVETSKVDVNGNIGLSNNINKITITVTAEDGSVGTYIINVNKEEKLSNNANLSSITIDGKNLVDFESSKTNYFYKTKLQSIKVDAVTEDENASFEVLDNTNLKKGSIVRIVVTAEDGTENEYLITIDVPNSGNAVIIIFIIILILVIGGGIFYFYTRQKNGGEKEYEYE